LPVPVFIRVPEFEDSRVQGSFPKTNTNEINNVTVAVIPAEAGIQKHVEKTGFPPARE